jgi:hypothetical protein
MEEFKVGNYVYLQEQHKLGKYKIRGLERTVVDGEPVVDAVWLYTPAGDMRVSVTAILTPEKVTALELMRSR